MFFAHKLFRSLISILFFSLVSQSTFCIQKPSPYPSPYPSPSQQTYIQQIWSFTKNNMQATWHLTKKFGHQAKKKIEQISKKLDKAAQGPIKSFTESPRWTQLCKFLVKIGRDVDSCESYKGHTFDELTFEQGKLPTHQYHRLKDWPRRKLIFLTCLQLSFSALSTMAMFMGNPSRNEKSSYDPCNEQSDSLTLALVPGKNRGCSRVVTENIYTIAGMITGYVLFKIEQGLSNHIFDPQFEKSSYDLCHNKPDGTTQCCTVHDNTFITCCRFDSKSNIIECGEIHLTGRPTENFYELRSNGELISYPYGQYDRRKISNSLDCPSSQGTIQKEYDQFLMKYPYDENDLPKIANTTEYNLQKFPVINMGEVTTAVMITNELSKVLQVNKIPLKLLGGRSKNILTAYYLPEYVGISEKILLSPMARGTLAHELGHKKQFEKNPIKKSFLVDWNIYWSNDFSSIYKDNIELNADIFGGLATEDAQKMAHQYLIYFYGLDQIDHSFGLPIRPNRTICMQSDFTNEKEQNPYTSHPNALYCRIPLLLELGEKYKKLDKDLENRVAQKRTNLKKQK